jgi:hypothetical protein
LRVIVGSPHFSRSPLDCTMLTNLMAFFRSYYAFYTRYFSDQWNGLNPVKYGMLLIGVGLFGWLLMKSGNKRA